MSDLPTDDVAERLHSAAIRLLRLLRREDAASALSAPRLSALSVVVFAGPMSLATLAEAEQVRPPTMSRIVDALVGEGLLTRQTAPADRRSVRIAATPKGVKLLDEGRARRVRALSARLARLSKGELSALTESVAILEQVLRDGPGSGNPQAAALRSASVNAECARGCS
jgi:DNA-binding MarR family transcriptional regulator